MKATRDCMTCSSRLPTFSTDCYLDRFFAVFVISHAMVFAFGFMNYWIKVEHLASSVRGAVR